MRLKPAWALCAIAAAIAIHSLAWGDSPPLTASLYAYDFGFQDAPGSGNSTVTIAPGGTIEFSYPEGSSSHNVVFDQDQPAACSQTAGTDAGRSRRCRRTRTGPAGRAPAGSTPRAPTRSTATSIPAR